MEDVEGRTLLASGGEDIKIWDLSSTVPLHHFTQHTDTVSNLSWSHNNQYLASSSSVGDKIVLNYVKNSTTSITELASGDKQTCLALNSSSRYLACGGKNRNVTVWDLKTKKLKKQYKGHKDAVCCITFNWNDTHIASGSSSGEILIHNVVSGQSGAALTTPEGQAIRSIQYSFFKKSYLAAVSDDGGLYLWDTNSSKLLVSFSNAHKAPATDLSFSPLNNLLLASCGLDKKILCYDVMGKKIIKTMVVDSPLTSLTFMHDGATLAAGSSRGKLFIFDLRKGAAPVKTLIGHKSSIQCLSFQHNVSAAKVNGTMGSTSKTKSTPMQNHHHSAVKKTSQQANTPDPGIAHHSKGDVPSAAGKQDVIDAEIPQPLRREGGSRPDSYGTAVFSPLNDDKKRDSSNSYSSGRLDGVGNDSESYNNSLTGGVFSPLPSTTTATDTRRAPIGSVSQSSSPYSVTPPVKTDVNSRTGPSINANNSTSSPLSVISPPRIASSGHPPLPAADSYQLPSDSIPDLSKFRTNQMDPQETTDNKTKLSEIRGRSSPSQLGVTDGSSLQGSQDVPYSDSAATAAAAAQQQEVRGATMATTERSQGHPPEQFQAEFIRNMIEDCLEDFKADVHRDITNLQVEMLRQFQIQQNEIQQLLKKYSVNEELLAEVERLREENKRLKSTF